jgi:hypothetical protein
MLVDDFGDQIAQLLKLIDMTGIHQHAIGQGTGLVATALMCLIEQWANLRVLLEQHFVEMSGERLSATFEQWNGSFDDGTILGIQHG